MAPATVPSRKTRKDFQRLAELRAKEAATLAKTGNHQGAYYLAGFAVECALKACIAKTTRRHEFPVDKDYAGKVYTHNLDQLLKLAHLDAQLDQDMEIRPELAKNWDLVRDWKVDSRYETSKLGGERSDSRRQLGGWSAAMDQTTLVNRDLNAGALVMEAISRTKIPITLSSGSTFRSSKSGIWSLQALGMTPKVRLKPPAR